MPTVVGWVARKGNCGSPRLTTGFLEILAALSLLAIKPPISEEVEIDTLDGMFGDSPCALLKIDVEGMEEDVIRGGLDLIKKNNPIIYVENDRLEKSKSLIALLLDLKYRLWWHVPPLFNPNNFFGNKENIYSYLTSCNMFCCRGEHEAATGIN